MRFLGTVALGVACVGGLLVTAVAIRVSWGGSYWVFGAVTGALVAGCALLRTVPAVVAAFVLAGAAVIVAATNGLPREPGPVVVLALGVLVAGAVRSRPVPAAAAVAAAGLAVVAASVVAAGGFAPIPVFGAAGWGVAVVTGLGLRALDARRHAAREAVRRDERLELARELHDVVAHHVTGIVVQAQAAQLAARRYSAPAPVTDALAGIEAAGSEALAAMRSVVGVLRDQDDATPVTTEDLDALLDRFAARNTPVLHRAVAPGAWRPEVTSTVYRVVQEALTNVARHAPSAGSVSVSVTDDPAALIVEVCDDAPSVPPRYHRRGYGLVGMRERVESLGGNLTAGPRPTVGWSVRAVLPR